MIVYKAIPVVAGIIKVDGFVLLTKKRSAHLDTNGFWEFPGGKVEDGESLEGALKREIWEELNKLDVQIDTLIHAQMNYYSFAGALVTYFRCVPLQCKYLYTLSDHLYDIEHVFVAPGQVNTLKVLPGTWEALNNVV